MNDPDPSAEILVRHLANLHELMREQSLRLRRIEAALGLMQETGRISPLGSLRGRVMRRHPVPDGDDPDAA